MEMIEPGAVGSKDSGAAALTIPWSVNTGGSVGDCKAPLIWLVPRSCRLASVACTVRLTFALDELVVQVPSQWPPLTDRSARGGSPFEKFTRTVPGVSRGLPQSSLTSTPSATGQPAEAANDCPRVVRAVSNCVGWQLAVSTASALAAPPDELPDFTPLETTIFALTTATRPSENWNVIGSRYTPEGSGPVNGCTTT